MTIRGYSTKLYNFIESTLLCLGFVALATSTGEGTSEPARHLYLDVVGFVTVCIGLDWICRALLASRGTAGHGGRGGWIRSRSSIICLLGFVPIALAAPFGWSPSSAPLLSVFWILRFARYSKGMDMLFAVLAREREAVLGVLYVFVAMLMVCAFASYALEHQAQPDKFGSIPLAFWWAVATLTTTGYGDVVPITLGGRLLAGLMMITGIVVFGLLAGILGSGFTQELRRHEFLRNWDLVKQVPIFRDIGPGMISDVAGLLRSREIPARTVVCRRGEHGAAMYFIVSGMVDVLVEPKRTLGPGDFFGEIALLSNNARTATVVAVRSSVLLVLDIADFRTLAASRPELLRSIEAEAKRRLGENALTATP